jgi:hypothetical protein
MQVGLPEDLIGSLVLELYSKLNPSCQPWDASEAWLLLAKLKSNQIETTEILVQVLLAETGTRISRGKHREERVLHPQ